VQMPQKRFVIQQISIFVVAYACTIIQSMFRVSHIANFHVHGAGLILTSPRDDCKTKVISRRVYCTYCKTTNCAKIILLSVVLQCYM